MNVRQSDELKTNIIKLVNDGKLNNKRIILYGNNQPAYKTIFLLRNMGYLVYKIIDAYKSIENNGVEVVTFEKFKKIMDDDMVYLIGSAYYEQMKATLTENGVDETKIYQTIAFAKNTLEESFYNEVISNLQKGKEEYTEIKSKFGEDCFILIYPYEALGDAYFISVYAKEYLRKNNYKKYLITIVGKGSKKVVDLFDFDNVELLTQEESDNLVSFVNVMGYEYTNSYVVTHNLIPNNNLIPFEIERKFTWIEMIKHIVMGLNETVKAQHPETLKRAEVDDMFKENKLIPGKTVIISPYAKTLMQIDEKIWEEIVDNLIEKGYTVCTNSSDPESEPVVRGTKKCFFYIKDANYFVEKAGTFIGLRSGLCDVIANADAKKIIIYPDDRATFFTMLGVDFAKNIDELVYDESKNFAQKVVDMVLINR